MEVTWGTTEDIGGQAAINASSNTVSKYLAANMMGDENLDEEYYRQDEAGREILDTFAGGDFLNASLFEKRHAMFEATKALAGTFIDSDGFEVNYTYKPGDRGGQGSFNIFMKKDSGVSNKTHLRHDAATSATWDAAVKSGTGRTGLLTGVYIADTVGNVINTATVAKAGKNMFIKGMNGEGINRDLRRINDAAYRLEKNDKVVKIPTSAKRTGSNPLAPSSDGMTETTWASRLNFREGSNVRVVDQMITSN
ncbi:hypothetical protein [Hydrogenimonas thermophila]|uniref:Uncharacterized protein n=1 Tax=Hydrogenimonas thermophila TaxID=223786 RepID=A0A1I5P3X2_9BACT|nr:hypothetical protein [Hydrogenimonas thermophila]SFP28749.1 hypothetical protein SAMN05216234_11342 [Hydrogenimonas thermophila]